MRSPTWTVGLARAHLESFLEKLVASMHTEGLQSGSATSVWINCNMIANILLLFCAYFFGCQPAPFGRGFALRFFTIYATMHDNDTSTNSIYESSHDTHLFVVHCCLKWKCCANKRRQGAILYPPSSILHCAFCVRRPGSFIPRLPRWIFHLAISILHLTSFGGSKAAAKHGDATRRTNPSILLKSCPDVMPKVQLIMQSFLPLK
jgi:hypothetical protein